MGLSRSRIDEVVKRVAVGERTGMRVLDTWLPVKWSEKNRGNENQTG
jgi:hypothetical protein